MDAEYFESLLIGYDPCSNWGNKWINTRGLDLANKVKLIAVAAENFKKLIKSRLNKPIFRDFDHDITYATCQLELATKS